MFFKAFDKVPAYFDNDLMQFKFESILSICFKGYTECKANYEDGFNVNVEEAVFFTFRKILRKNPEMAIGLTNALKDVLRDVDYYLNIALNDPESFSMPIEEYSRLLHELDQPS